MGNAIGLIGAGGIGSVHAEELRSHPDASLVAICDANLERAVTLADETDASRYSSVGPMLAEHHLDGVYVCTPPGTHRDIIAELARSEVPIFCEKPLAASLADARAIVETVSETRTRMMLGFCLRFAHTTARFKSVIENGTIGTPVMRTSQRTGMGIPEAGNWRLNPGQACGVTIESTAHNIDLLRWLGGEITSATGVVRNVTMPDLETFDDNVVGALAFADGAIGLLQTSWTAGQGMLRHGVIGTDGAVILEGDGWWRHDRLIEHTGPEEAPTITEFSEAEATDMGYAGETDAFLEMLDAGRAPPVDARDGLRALEVATELRDASEVS